MLSSFQIWNIVINKLLHHFADWLIKKNEEMKSLCVCILVGVSKFLIQFIVI